MKDRKKRNIVWILFFAMLSLSLAAASAQDQRTCSAVSVAGQWGYTDTGTLITPNGPVSFAVVGTITVEVDGSFSGTQTSNAGGSVSKNILKGTGTLKSDCTGTNTVRVYDESGATLLRTATFSVVFVDNAREEREIATSLVLEPSGTALPAIITGNAKKLFPNKGSRQ